MKKIHVFVLLILPVILVITAALLHYAHGPYWLAYNTDPEYMYLCNSLALSESKQVFFNGNPGMTLQWLGAATLKISYALDFISAKDSFEFEVLKNPELYLTILNIVLITFNTLLLFIIGLVTFTLTKNIWLSLLLQFSPFLANALLINGLSRVSPEPLLMFAGLLLVLILVKMIVSENLSKSVHWYMIALALVSGFGIATKVTFVPLLIIPLFILPKFRNKIGFLFLTGLSVILWIWPIIPQYKSIYYWFYGILTHTGPYGTGDPGIINPGLYFQSLQHLFLGNPLFFLIWFFAAGFILKFNWSSVTRKTAWQDTSFRILVAVVVAQLCAVLIVAKHCNDRYLVPVLLLSGFMLFLIFVYLKRHNYFNRFDTKKTVFFIGILFILISAWRIYDIKNVFMQNLQIKRESLVVYLKVENEYKNYLKIAYSFPASSASPISALSLGNYYTKGLYSEVLRKIYGEAYFYSILKREFHTWTKVFFIEDVISKGYGNKIIFYGPPIFKENGDQVSCETGSTLHLKDVLQGEYDTIYVLHGITIPKGSAFYLHLKHDR